MNYEKQDTEQFNLEAQETGLTPLQILAILIGIGLLVGLAYTVLTSSGSSAVKAVGTSSAASLTASEIAAMLST